MNTSSLAKPLMILTPDIEDDMWWMTGDFIRLSSFFDSRTPLFIMRSSRTNKIAMKKNPIAKYGYRTHTSSTYEALM